MPLMLQAAPKKAAAPKAKKPAAAKKAVAKKLAAKKVCMDTRRAHVLRCRHPQLA